MSLYDTYPELRHLKGRHLEQALKQLRDQGVDTGPIRADFQIQNHPGPTYQHLTPTAARDPDVHRDLASTLHRAALPHPPDSITITLPLDLASLNHLAYAHWRRRTNHKRQARHAIDSSPLPTVKPHPTHKPTIKITRILGPRQRPFDLDNLAGGTAKHLIDRIIEKGYARDDTPTSVTITYHQDDTHRQHGPATRITITQTA